MKAAYSDFGHRLMSLKLSCPSPGMPVSLPFFMVFIKTWLVSSSEGIPFNPVACWRQRAFQFPLRYLHFSEHNSGNLRFKHGKVK